MNGSKAAGEDAIALVERHVFGFEKALQSRWCIGAVGKPAPRRLGDPFLGVAVAVEDDAAVVADDPAENPLQPVVEVLALELLKFPGDLIASMVLPSSSMP